MSPLIDSHEYRHVLGHVPTGVVIVTLADDGRPLGVTVGSFVSMSLRPPLIGFTLKRTSETSRHLGRVTSFAVNVLGDNQSDLGWRFSACAEDRFTDVAWSAGCGGAPLLDDAVAHLECTVARVLEVGDHSLIVGAVHDLRVVSDSSPLVFLRGRFATVAD